jgi:hypothetical protein
MTLELRDLVALVALILSGYATWRTIKFNERQKSLIEVQERLNTLLLAKQQNEVTSDRKADLGASFIKLGTSKYRLKIWNKGKAAARNIQIDFPEGNDVVDQSDIDAKFPLEILETYQAVELVAAVSFGTKPKQAIRLRWEDDFQAQNEKIAYPTI